MRYDTEGHSDQGFESDRSGVVSLTSDSGLEVYEAVRDHAT
jgi:hypothetical protein